MNKTRNERTEWKFMKLRYARRPESCQFLLPLLSTRLLKLNWNMLKWTVGAEGMQIDLCVHRHQTVASTCSHSLQSSIFNIQSSIFNLWSKQLARSTDIFKHMLNFIAQAFAINFPSESRNWGDKRNLPQLLFYDLWCPIPAAHLNEWRFIMTIVINFIIRWTRILCQFLSSVLFSFHALARVFTRSRSIYIRNIWSQMFQTMEFSFSTC